MEHNRSSIPMIEQKSSWTSLKMRHLVLKTFKNARIIGLNFHKRMLKLIWIEYFRFKIHLKINKRGERIEKVGVRGRELRGKEGRGDGSGIIVEKW